MTWTDRLSTVRHPDGRQLIGASFRGVAFYVSSSDRSGGRRLASHEFIQQDDPVHDDRGGKIKRFAVEGYVIGEDYAAQRDELIAALEGTAGAGALVHPYYGELRAVCEDMSVREVIADGRVATFQILFLNAPLVQSPSAGVDVVGSAESEATSALAISLEEADANVDTDGAPSYALQSLGDDLEAMAVEVGDKLRPLAQTTQELARVSVEIDIITAQATSLIRTPSGAVLALLSAVALVETALENQALSVARALLDVYATARQALAIGDTLIRVTERANQVALGDALRRAMVFEAARLMVGVEFESVEEALEERQRVLDALDALSVNAVDSLESITLLRARVVDAIPGDANLASQRTLSVRLAKPAILVAFEEYGSAEQEADVIARNNVRDPQFVSGDVVVVTQ